MPRKKYDYDINQVELTHVKSGDMDNNVYYSYFSVNEDLKKKTLDTLLKKNALQEIVDKIFSADISDDQFRKITTALTFFAAVIEITNAAAPPIRNINDLYFAALVNWNASKGNGTNKIRSYSSLASVHDSVESSGGDELDYREYIIKGDGEGNFNGDYINIVISPKEFSCKMQVNLPIIMSKLGGKLGFFRLATDRVPGYMTLLGDPDNSALTIPPHLWMSMIEEGMSNRITTRFSKLEARGLQKLVSTDHQNIDEILAINDFGSAANFMNIYDIEFDDNSGILHILNTEEPPELNSNDFEWARLKKGEYYLKSPRFYLAATHGNTVHILVQ